MANCVDNCISEPPSKSKLSRPRLSIARVQCHRKIDTDDELWVKIRRLAIYLRGSRYFCCAESKSCIQLLKNDSLESALADLLASRFTGLAGSFYNTVNEDIKTLREVFLRTFTEDPEIRRAIRDDLRAARVCNPHGGIGMLDVFLSSGFLALQAYRVAHKFWSLNKESMAKKIQELASKAFNIDIHPGAKIASGTYIDECGYRLVVLEEDVIGGNATNFGYNRISARETLPGQKINYESLNGLADEESVSVPYDGTCKLVTANKESFCGKCPDGRFRQKLNTLSPRNEQGGQSYEDGGRHFHAIQVDESDRDSIRSTEKSLNGTDLDGGFHQKVNDLSPGSGQEGERYEDSGRQFHAMQVESDHGSVRSAENDPHASPSSINTLFAYNSRDEQPPHDRSLSGNGNTGEMVQEERGFDLSGLAKIFIPISAGEGFIVLDVGYSAGNSLSEKSKILLFSAAVCSVFAFLFCSCGYFMQSSRRAKSDAQLMTVGGVVTAI